MVLGGLLVLAYGYIVQVPRQPLGGEWLFFLNLFMLENRFNRISSHKISL